MSVRVRQAPHLLYPGIAKAALEISYDNGGINRDRSEAKHRRDLNRFMAREPMERDQLQAIDKFLTALSEGDLQLVTAGEQSECDEFLRRASAPPFLSDLLCRIFEKVC